MRWRRIRAIRRVESRARQPTLEVGVVVELLEQFGVIGQQPPLHRNKPLSAALRNPLLLLGFRVFPLDLVRGRHRTFW